MSEQKVTALCLLDLSAAFDTIDNPILLHHLSSWFGFDDTLISWLTSYLSSQNFVVLSTLFPLQIIPFVNVFLKDQSLVHSHSYSTLLLSILFSLIRLSAIIYLLVISKKRISL